MLVRLETPSFASSQHHDARPSPRRYSPPPLTQIRLLLQRPARRPMVPSSSVLTTALLRWWSRLAARQPEGRVGLRRRSSRVSRGRYDDTPSRWMRRAWLLNLRRALQFGLARCRRSVVRAVVRGRTIRALHTLNSITPRHTRGLTNAVWPATRGGKDPPHETPHTSPTQFIPELSQKHEHRIFIRPSAHSFPLVHAGAHRESTTLPSCINRNWRCAALKPSEKGTYGHNRLLWPSGRHLTSTQRLS